MRAIGSGTITRERSKKEPPNNKEEEKKRRRGKTQQLLRNAQPQTRQKFAPAAHNKCTTSP
jgi:hypothetical protein